MDTTIDSPDEERLSSHEEHGRRRPISVRETPAFRRVANALNSAGVRPNQVSVAGLVAGLGVGLALVMTSFVEGGLVGRVCWALAIVGILFRGACNILDGILAVECGKSTPAGHLYNEVPDRISDVVMLVGAGYAMGGMPVLGWSAALVALFVAYVRVQIDVAGARQSFVGPMAKPARMAVIGGAAFVHMIVPDPLSGLDGQSGPWGAVSLALAVIVVGGCFTALRRLVAGGRELERNQAR